MKLYQYTQADFDLWQTKYSLVFYLDVGDQSVKKPGLFKVYEPDTEILPYDGMCVHMPASRDHSVVYDGETDRVMVGINAYCV